MSLPMSGIECMVTILNWIMTGFSVLRVETLSPAYRSLPTVRFSCFVKQNTGRHSLSQYHFAGAPRVPLFFLSVL